MGAQGEEEEAENIYDTAAEGDAVSSDCIASDIMRRVALPTNFKRVVTLREIDIMYCGIIVIRQLKKEMVKELVPYLTIKLVR